METQDIFCANDQTETEHSLELQGGSIVATCLAKGCGRILKFPDNVTTSQFQELIAKHKQANMGQEVVAPGGVGPADVYVAPSDHVPDSGPSAPQGPELGSLLAPADPGERVADDLTPEERNAWEAMNKS
jgi:hypothetical protein